MKILVTSACYDNIGMVLDSMNIKYENYNDTGVINCDILFMNCGSSDYIPNEEVFKFVKNGGVLYASDLMSSYINDTFPNIFDFYSSGNSSTILAKIVDNRIIEYLGNNIEIHFDMGGWSMLRKISKGTVLLSRIDNGDPLMVEVPFKKGSIFYTSFHNNAQASEKEITLLKILILKQISVKDKTSIKEVADKFNVDISMLSNNSLVKKTEKSKKINQNIDEFDFGINKQEKKPINLDDFNF
jgi:hypothetical protein